MGSKIERDQELKKAREQLRELNLDLKVEKQHGEVVVIAVEREKGGRPLKDVPPLPYPSPELAQWVGGITARVTRS